MSEVTSSFAKINNAASPYTTREQTQKDQSEKVANRWARFLRKKGQQNDMMAFSPQVRPSRLTRVRNAAASWIQLLWARRVSKAQQQELRQNIVDSRRTMRTYVRLAQFAINLAVETEPNRETSLTKKRILWEKWRTMYQGRSNL